MIFQNLKSQVGHADVLGMAEPLTPEEDAELRRLHVLAQYADAAPTLIARYRELRARDRRANVREVTEEQMVKLLPSQRANDPYPAEPRPRRSTTPT